MKSSRRIKQNQIELFFEPDLTGDPMLLELPAERRVELEKVLADLLLNAALGDAKVAGGVHDDAE
jgi:hypothetical protein